MKFRIRDNPILTLHSVAWQRTDVKSADLSASGITFLLHCSDYTCIDSSYHDSSLHSKLILDLAEEAFDTMTLFLFTSFNLLMLITHKGSHGSSQRTHAFTHPRAFGGEDDSLHSSLSVVPTIIRTIGGVVARRHNSVNILDLLF
jgi:hypothetical protein